MEHLKVNQNKINFLWKVITRFDHYINSTNTKASLVIAWNGIVIGTVLVKYEIIIKAFSENQCDQLIVAIGLGILCISSLISIFFVFGVVTPSIPKNKNQKNLIYFGSVSTMDQQQYHSLLSESNDSSIITDLTLQATELATILEKKMEKTKISILFMCIGLFIIYLMLAYKIII
ncbi:MAG: DUF5706 domain-containing protein [Patescibacteria group bacterium]|nr:DUF5706 domain-containing protein [Patescibacteria group bacterium]